MTNYYEDDDGSVTEVTTNLLQDECDEFTNAFVAQADEDTLIKLKDFADRLKGTKIVDRAHKVPQCAPDFELPDQHGNLVELSDLLQQKDGQPVVISFFRGSWCPYCSFEIKALNRYHQKLQKKGAALIAISPMLLDKTQLMTDEYVSEENGIQFPVLSDVHNVVAKKYGLVFTVDQMLHGIYQSFGFDLPAFNGDDSWELPIPATYVVLPTSERRIHFAMVDTDYSKRTEPTRILKALQDAKKPIGMGSNEEEDREEKRARKEARRKRREEKEKQQQLEGVNKKGKKTLKEDKKKNKKKSINNNKAERKGFLAGLFGVKVKA